MQSNFKPWCSVYLGNALVQAEPSRCSNSSAMARSPAQLAHQSIAATIPLRQNRPHDFACESRSINPEELRSLMDMLHAWMLAQRDLAPEGSAISRALDYSLKRWAALSRYLNDGAIPIDSNWAENQIRPWELGRKNWLFAGSLRSGKRAAAIMTLIQSARMNGHDPYGYLKDVLTQLPTQRASEIGRLLPHQWVAPSH